MTKKFLESFILGIVLQIISIGIGVALVLIIQSKSTLVIVIIVSLFGLLYLFGSIINLIEAGKIIGLKRTAEDILNKKGSLPIDKDDTRYREHYTTIKITTKGHKIKDVVVE